MKQIGLFLKQNTKLAIVTFVMMMVFGISLFHTIFIVMIPSLYRSMEEGSAIASTYHLNTRENANFWLWLSLLSGFGFMITLMIDFRKAKKDIEKESKQPTKKK